MIGRQSTAARMAAHVGVGLNRRPFLMRSLIAVSPKVSGHASKRTQSTKTMTRLPVMLMSRVSVNKVSILPLLVRILQTGTDKSNNDTRSPNGHF